MRRDTSPTHVGSKIHVLRGLLTQLRRGLGAWEWRLGPWRPTTELVETGAESKARRVQATVHVKRNNHFLLPGPIVISGGYSLQITTRFLARTSYPVAVSGRIIIIFEETITDSPGLGENMWL